jgi:hypothetical protein
VQVAEFNRAGNSDRRTVRKAALMMRYRRSLPKGHNMSIESELLRMAQEVVAESQAGSAYAYKAYVDAQARTAQLKAKLDFANLAEDRLANFQAKIGADYQCPRCWVEQNSRAPLFPRRGAEREDIFECRNGHELSISH